MIGHLEDGDREGFIQGPILLEARQPVPIFDLKWIEPQEICKMPADINFTVRTEGQPNDFPLTRYQITNVRLQPPGVERGIDRTGRFRGFDRTDCCQKNDGYGPSEVCHAFHSEASLPNHSSTTQAKQVRT